MSASATSHRVFRLQPGATVAAGIGILVLIGLGIWQLDRLQWKTALIAAREAASTAEPIGVPAQGADLAGLDFRRAHATGQFDHAREMLLAARSMNGNPGYHVVTPFVMTDGRTLLVDRGWIPPERQDPARRAEGQIAGETEVEGLIRLPRAQHWLEPDNDPAHGTWFWVDPAAMGEAAGVPEGKLAPVYLEAGPAPNPGGFPIGGQSRVALPNDHLQYAITWFALAAGLAGVWFFYCWRPEEEGR
jgi:surfeit locus 1 family protein